MTHVLLENHPHRDPLCDPPADPPEEAALLVDTETTNADDDGEVIELALAWWPQIDRAPGALEVERFQPQRAIKHGAMATHHIIPADLVACRPSTCAALPIAADFMIAHNVDFDWRMLGSPPAIKRICTLALARLAWPTLDNHQLGTVIYSLYPPEAARDFLRNAHAAGDDVINLARVVRALVDHFGARSFAHLYELSEDARVPRYITFGKHKPKAGEPPKPIAELPRDYREWMLRQPDMDPYMKIAIERSFGRLA
jgi:exodeoxyribonuclease X